MPEEDIHIIEAIGRTRVVVKAGQVVEVGEPMIAGCPLARRFARPVHMMRPDEIRANIEERIRSFGYCTKDRAIIQTGDFVLFGASELLSCAIRTGIIECAVIVCEGAGTVIVHAPDMVQGIGGRASGLVKTSPIPEVIERIEAHGGSVVDPRTAAIDMVHGVEEAYRRGCSRVAVTVAACGDAEVIRQQFPETLIIGVHATGLSREEAECMVAACDIVSACASRHIRDLAGAHALLQGGIAVPVFALTQRGKDLILAKISETAQQVLIRGARLPEHGENEPEPLL
jgi:putative methanogenesis marker protein 8